MRARSLTRRQREDIVELSDELRAVPGQDFASQDFASVEGQGELWQEIDEAGAAADNAFLGVEFPAVETCCWFGCWTNCGAANGLCAYALVFDEGSTGQAPTSRSLPSGPFDALAGSLARCLRQEPEAGEARQD